MKGKRYTILVFWSLLLLVLTGCERREVLDNYPVSGVNIILQWEGVTDKLPEGVRVIFYPKNGQGRKVDTYLSAKGGIAKVPPGRYSVVVYNYDTEAVQFRGVDEYGTIEAFTGHCTGLGAGTEELVWGPDPLYIVNMDDVRVTNSEEVLIMECTPKLAVKTYKFSMPVKGLEYTSNVIGQITGMANSYFIGSAYGKSTSSIYFEISKNGDQLEGCFCTFGLPKGFLTRADMSVEMKLVFVKTDNTVQEVKLDITDVIVKAETESGGSTNPPEGGQPPSTNIELPIDKDNPIEVEKPTNPPPGGGGGIGGEVGGWGEEEDVELPMD